MNTTEEPYLLTEEVQPRISPETLAMIQHAHIMQATPNPRPPVVLVGVAKRIAFTALLIALGLFFLGCVPYLDPRTPGPTYTTWETWSSENGWTEGTAWSWP